MVTAEKSGNLYNWVTDVNDMSTRLELLYT